MRQSNDLRVRVQNENVGFDHAETPLTVMTRLLRKRFSCGFLCNTRGHVLHFGMHATVGRQ
jgi:hypothetical protein